MELVAKQKRLVAGKKAESSISPMNRQLSDNEKKLKELKSKYKIPSSAKSLHRDGSTHSQNKSKHE